MQVRTHAQIQIFKREILCAWTINTTLHTIKVWLVHINVNAVWNRPVVVQTCGILGVFSVLDDCVKLTLLQIKHGNVLLFSPLKFPDTFSSHSSREWWVAALQVRYDAGGCLSSQPVTVTLGNIIWLKLCTNTTNLGLVPKPSGWLKCSVLPGMVISDKFAHETLKGLTSLMQWLIFNGKNPGKWRTSDFQTVVAASSRVVGQNWY